MQWWFRYASLLVIVVAWTLTCTHEHMIQAVLCSTVFTLTEIAFRGWIDGVRKLRRRQSSLHVLKTVVETGHSTFSMWLLNLFWFRFGTVFMFDWFEEKRWLLLALFPINVWLAELFGGAYMLLFWKERAWDYRGLSWSMFDGLIRLDYILHWYVLGASHMLLMTYVYVPTAKWLVDHGWWLVAPGGALICLGAAIFWTVHRRRAAVVELAEIRVLEGRLENARHLLESAWFCGKRIEEVRCMMLERARELREKARLHEEGSEYVHAWDCVDEAALWELRANSDDDGGVAVDAPVPELEKLRAKMLEQFETSGRTNRDLLKQIIPRTIDPEERARLKELF